MKKYYLIIGIISILFSACESEEDSIGVCEVKSSVFDFSSQTYHTAYYCSHGLDAQAICEDERTAVYHESSSCRDLGYPELASYMSLPYGALITIDGWKTPGSTGSYSHEYSDESSSGGSSSGGSGGKKTYEWAYTCLDGYGGGGTVEITEGSCESSQKNFAKVFGCNDMDNFKSACISYYSCIGASTDYCNNY